MLGNHFLYAASPTFRSPFHPLSLPRTLSIAAVVLAASLPGMAADSVATNSPNGAPLSQRVVAYAIDAKLVRFTGLA
ncbi:MAG: hypothetical protein WCD57_11715 [Acidobacteriaceae bacterium]